MGLVILISVLLLLAMPIRAVGCLSEHAKGGPVAKIFAVAASLIFGGAEFGWGLSLITLPSYLQSESRLVPIWGYSAIAGGLYLALVGTIQALLTPLAHENVNPSTSPFAGRVSFTSHYPPVSGPPYYCKRCGQSLGLDFSCGRCNEIQSLLPTELQLFCRDCGTELSVAGQRCDRCR